jgi:hypothetical protein
MTQLRAVDYLGEGGGVMRLDGCLPSGHRIWDELCIVWVDDGYRSFVEHGALAIVEDLVFH